MAVKIGKDCAVKLGTGSVLGMGTWSLSGITSDSLESTEFGDQWKQFKFGIKDGGQVTFSGLFFAADTTGQDVLKNANLENTNITNLRLYIDNTSYLEPCQTTSWWTASDSTNNDTFPSHVNVTSYDISADKSGLMQTSFTCKVSGCMVMV
jgi:hypothetical protein